MQNMVQLAADLSPWQPDRTAPFDCELELAVIDYNGPQDLVFPSHRVLNGWVKAETWKRIEVYPTHWRRWNKAS